MIIPNYAYKVPIETVVDGEPAAPDAKPAAVLWRNGVPSGVAVVVDDPVEVGLYWANFTTGDWPATDHLVLRASAEFDESPRSQIVWDSRGNVDAPMRGTDDALTSMLKLETTVVEGLGGPVLTLDTVAGISPADLIAVFNSGGTEIIRLSVVRIVDGGENKVTFSPPFPDDFMTAPGTPVRIFQPGSLYQVDTTVTPITLAQLNARTLPSSDYATAEDLNFVLFNVMAVPAGVWNRLLTEANHNIEDSAGRMLRVLSLEAGEGGAVNVLPGIVRASQRVVKGKLRVFVGETVTQDVTVYQADGKTPFDLSGKTVEFVVERKTGKDVDVVDDITILGEDNNIVRFAYTQAITAVSGTRRWAIRDASSPLTLYGYGDLEIIEAPLKDENNS